MEEKRVTFAEMTKLEKHQHSYFAAVTIWWLITNLSLLWIVTTFIMIRYSIVSGLLVLSAVETQATGNAATNKIKPVTLPSPSPLA